MAKKFVTKLVVLVGFFSLGTALARGVEISAKGSLSRSNFTRTEYETTFSGSTGLAFVLFPQVKVEARYIFRYSERNLQTYVPGVFASEIKTSKNIYSVGMSIDVLSDKYPVQPYLYLGGGYIESVSKYVYSQYEIVTPGEQTNYEPSLNGGIGFRVRIGRSVGFEIEAFGYATELNEPQALIDWFGSAGLRFYL